MVDAVTEGENGGVHAETKTVTWTQVCFRVYFHARWFPCTQTGWKI